MADKAPKPGTRRRALFDLLIANAGEWVEFDAASLGYSDSRNAAYDLRSLREAYEMDIRTEGSGLKGCRWRYVPAISSAHRG